MAHRPSRRLFTCVQAYEYSHAAFGFKGNIYGATFFMATGFHGAHVLIGTIFLVVCLIRVYVGHFTPTQHLGFEFAAWYWHFVDVVWLFLFACIYVWGAGRTVAAPRRALAPRRAETRSKGRLGRLCPFVTAGALASPRPTPPSQGEVEDCRSSWRKRPRRPCVPPPGAALTCRCPRCGEGKLFKGFLTLRPRCDACGLDYDFVDAGDGPAVFVILAAGFIVVVAALARRSAVCSRRSGCTRCCGCR